ncbi:hypothetical protein BN1058_02304 [Paraliobacillus sp. PM-2]|uniref:hypothetical protein n=1 Tax=Paraliobacillus sp. PM-2 TaxID=1462524 RepID=UPI00061C3D77|nr:hypothetical protein [Paraliobacillus sp. PM-2]CQR47968.1 hypothetical protein BN1058_02304 [Paraliobacillus sp. PM-2]
MKKGKYIFIVLGATLILLSPIFASAAQGTWRSSWGYDVNGASGIGATNAMEEPYYYQFQVWGAGSEILSSSFKQIGGHQSYETTHWSAPLKDKQGRIAASPQVWFTPYFNH